MQTIEVCKGTVYAITSPAGCTVTNAAGNVLATVDAGVQKAVVATDAQLNVSDDTATITQVFGTSSSGIGDGGGSYTLTAEAVQEVVPFAWGEYTTSPTVGAQNGIAIGGGAKSPGGGISVGFNALSNWGGAISIGEGSVTSGAWGVAIGYGAAAAMSGVAIGADCKSYGGSINISGGNLSPESPKQVIAIGAGVKKPLGLTIGRTFTENVDGTNVTRTCTTEGTGSITIGAGANTLNTTASDGTVTESSNAVTIGCKAENKGADAVVIGAQASGKNAAVTCVGASSIAGVYGVAVGKGSQGGNRGVSVGNSSYSFDYGVAIGFGATNAPGKERQIAIGANAISAGYGVTVIGNSATASASQATAFGYQVTSTAANAITIGAQFDETTGAGNVTRTCSTEGAGSITIGAGANTLNTTTTVDGVETTVESSNSVTIGCKTITKKSDSVVIGAAARADGGDFPSVLIGSSAVCTGTGNNVAIGALSVSSGADTNVGHNARVYGGNCVGIGANVSNAICPKTIAIGSAAKITNTTAADGTVTQSENTTVIGYGASASAPNAVVLGAGASTAGDASVVIGASSTNKAFGSVTVGAGAGSTSVIGHTYSVALGNASKNTGQGSTAIGSSTSAALQAVALGRSAQATTNYAIAIGAGAQALGKRTAAVGSNARSADTGCITFASWSEETGGINTKTQLYFSGANTPLANTYEDGEAMMGYVVTDKDGNTMAAGTQKLSVLFPNNSTFQPATLGLDDEYVVPKVFHPSDLDLPVEEPAEEPEDITVNILEPEEEEPYTPLPVYPIAEPENVEVDIPESEPYAPLPVYPIVEPEIEE